MDILEKINTQRTVFYGLGRENISLINYLISKKLIQKVYFADQQELKPNFSIPHQQVAISEIKNFELIFKAPGISKYAPELKGLDTTSPNQVFFDLNSGFKICVTGSKGKSTFCTLLAELLHAAGKKVLQAGNTGLPLCDYIEDTYDYAVIELSSYQLANLNIHANIAVLTSLFPEHLNWHLTKENYYKDKLSLFDSADIILKLEDQTESYACNNPYFQAKHLAVCLGGAISICKQTLEEDFAKHEIEIHAATENFRGLAHRLETIYQDQDLQIVNDSISTAPESVIAALEAFPKKETILVLGGLDRGLDQSLLIDYINATPPKAVICLPETGKQIYPAINTPKFQANDLKEACNKAISLRSKNSLILFSPGAASYNEFKNFEERGEAFNSTMLAIV